MSKEQIKNNVCYSYALDSLYNSIDDPSTYNWSESELLGFLGFVGSRQDESGIYVDVCASILITITSSQRENFLSKYIIPNPVTERYNALSGVASWPAKPNLVYFTDMESQSLENYKTSNIAKFKINSDLIINEVIDTSARSIYTSLWIVNEAVENSKLVNTIDKENATQFPGLEGYRVRNLLNTIEDAATQVLSRGRSFATADAYIQSVRITAENEINSAESVEDVDTAYNTNWALVVTTIQALGA